MSEKTKTKVIMDTGAHAAAFAVKSAKVDVVPGYPITPQTSIMETVSELIDAGEMDARFIPVEGEHSVMAAAAAASATGARVFTATSSQGLLYMAEVLHFTAGSRLPVVLANVNRGIFAPWTLFADHQDSLSMRDSGWIQLYCGTVQEIYNTILQAFRIAESVDIPVMVNFDGFTLSHCMMPLEIPAQEAVDAFLPPRQPSWKLDPNDPTSLSNVTLAKEYSEYRQYLSEDDLTALENVKTAAAEYKDHTGFWDGDTIDTYRMEDAEVVVFAMGSMASELRLSVDRLREQGVKAGLLRLRLFRPFPAEDILAALPENCTLAVLDRNYSYGHNEGGILAAELRSALFGKRNDVTVLNRVMGIGGMDLTWQWMAEEIAALLKEEK